MKTVASAAIMAALLISMAISLCAADEYVAIFDMTINPTGTENEWLYTFTNNSTGIEDTWIPDELGILGDLGSVEIVSAPDGWMVDDGSAYGYCAYWFTTSGPSVGNASSFTLRTSNPPPTGFEVGIGMLEWVNDPEGTGFIQGTANLVPEPGTFAVLASAISGLGLVMRRRIV